MFSQGLKHVFTVGGLTAVSRVLGLVREMLQARLIGAGVEQSAFALAFALPNMARKLFGEGALTAAFVPVFKGLVERGEMDAARRLARAVITLVMLILGAVVALTLVGIALWLQCASFFDVSPSPRTVLTLRLVRVLFPYMIFICGAALGMGVLNALGRFVEGAFMPALLNVIWIGALGLLCFFPGWTLATRITFVSAAILAGGMLQMAFLFRCMSRRGMSPRFVCPAILRRRNSLANRRNDEASSEAAERLVWRNTLTAALGAGAVQVNYMLDQVLAQCAAPWAAGVIGYAERLMDLPLGVVGVAFGTVLLPTFSGHFARHDDLAARRSFCEAIRHLSLVMVPAAVGLFVLAHDVTAVIYEGQAFDATSTTRVARAVAVYALGLGCFGFHKAIVPWFQAQGDLKTPLRVSLLTVIVNAVLNVLSVLLLPQPWRHVGLAGSTVFCALVGCAVLTGLAVRKNGALGLRGQAPCLLKITLAAVLMGVALHVLQPFVATWPRVLSLAALVVSGVVVYALILVALRVHKFR